MTLAPKDTVNRTVAGSRLKQIRDWRHLELLVAIIVLLVLQPLVAYLGVLARVLSDAAMVAVGIGLFAVVFDQHWERRLALLLVLPALVGNFAYYALAGGLRTAAVVLYHCSALAFLGFAVVIILRAAFRREAIRVDDIIGAACGFLLASLAWANIYGLVYALVPGSFHVPGDIAWQLTDWHTQRALFQYFSIVTLTSLGYGDITPTSPALYALIGLEVVFGVFYLAVVVAQLVGLFMVRRSGK